MTTRTGPWFRTTSIAIGVLLGLTGRVLHAADALDRLEAGRLARVAAARADLAAARQTLPRTGTLSEYRVNLHVHSLLSHDSRGSVAEIVAAARAAGTDAVLFTEHPTTEYDFVADGHAGLRDGVLLVPGAETQGLLLFPRVPVPEHASLSPQDLVRRVRQRGGLAFLSHLEERLDWQLDGLTGCEIYNTHADAKEEQRLFAAMKNPLWLLQVAPLVKAHPQEAFSALQDEPTLYLRRWDELGVAAAHTGVSANDAHRNIGLVARLADDGRVRVCDALDEELVVLDAGLVRGLLPVPEGARAGAELFRLQLDPYECSLRHVGTHVLAEELSRDGIFAALEAGRAFVAFDWIASATGFDCALVDADGRHELGSQVPAGPGRRLEARAPLPGHWRVVQGGAVVHEADGARLGWDVPATATGPLRVEVWLDVADERLLWVISNPFHLRPAG
jgi:hypothetical protein